MEKSLKKIPMGFTKELYPEGTHMCLIYDNDEHRKNIIGKFLEKGISTGEQVGYFTDKTSKKEVEDWLMELGVNIPRVTENNSFEIFIAENVYCPSGKFDPHNMLNQLGNCYSKAIKNGFKGSRVSGEMSWALKGIPGSDKLLEYEALINTISTKRPVTPICQYDSRLFDGVTIINVLKVHPLMIVKGQIVRNPYYVTPDEFLSEFNL